MSLAGPIYFNGTTGPMQTIDGNQRPVVIDGADFEFWCCLDECLVQTYQEHRVALGQGEDTSACITSATLKNWLAANYNKFIDHDRVGAPLSDNLTSFVFFTQARWYEVAGIDGTWQLGDLAKAFNALKWTRQTTGVSLCDASATTGRCLWTLVPFSPTDPTDCQEAYDRFVADADPDCDEPGIVPYKYRVTAEYTYQEEPPESVVYGAYTSYGAYRHTLTKHVNCAVDFYALPQKPIIELETTVFEDIYSVGFVEGQYWFISGSASSSIEVVDSDVVGNDTGGNPVDLSNYFSRPEHSSDCPLDRVMSGIDISSDDITVVLKWEFTEC